MPSRSIHMADGSTTSGIGVYLNNTSGVELNWMQLNDFQNSGIVGRSVNGFTLSNSVISGVSGNSTGPVEGPLNFGLSNPGGANGLQGTGVIRNTRISGGIEHNVEFYNQSGSMNLTIEGLTEDIQPKQKLTVVARTESGEEKRFTVTARLDSPVEVEYYKNGGILQTVLRNFLKQQQ